VRQGREAGRCSMVEQEDEEAQDPAAQEGGETEGRSRLDPVPACGQPKAEVGEGVVGGVAVCVCSGGCGQFQSSVKAGWW